jgi:tRNA pseudouridine-54 N-methylase
MIDGCRHFDSISIPIITWYLNTTTPQDKRDKPGSSFSVDMACQAYRNSFYFSHYSKYMNLFVHNHFADLRFVSIYLWQNKRIGENGPSLMRHIYKRFFLKIEELRNYVKKKERTSEQCHEFVKKNKNRPILRGIIVLMILFIRSHL